jgi:hypothetical protein
MKGLKTFLLMGCFAWLCVCLTPKAKADDWDQKTILTFDEPVRLPGIVLPAGEYVFRLAGLAVDRNVVQIYSRDEKKFYANIQAIPDYRGKSTNDALIVYEEKASGEPRAIKEWFFPDRRFGHEFVYSKAEALQPAKAEEPMSSIKPAGSTEWQSEENDSAGTTEPSAITPSEESDYMQVLHQKQTDSR